MKSSKFRIIIISAFILFIIVPGFSQERYPGKTWEIAKKTEALGYSSVKIESAQKFTQSIKTAAVVIVVNGIILAEWGEVDKKFMTHSIRKSFLSALYGNYVKDGTIDLDQSMADLGIDDEPPLSDIEKRATIRDCIKARFGLLMLRKGKWNIKQVIPKEWVEESTRYHSDASLYGRDGYGYMWWVARDFNNYSHLPNVSLKEGAYSARGAGGHYILIIPDYDMVIVHRVDTFEKDNRVSSSDFGTLVKMILEAKMN